MSKFPQRYSIASEDILSDIFYLDGLSNRGRATLIRQYTEILCRILLKADEHFYLGKFKERLDSEIPDAPLKDQIVCAVTDITTLGNAATHLDKGLKEIITDKDIDQALENLNFIISYLFINFINQNSSKDLNIVHSLISLLPPFIRVKIWQGMHSIDDKTFDYIDKLVLAILKSDGKDSAKNWLEENKLKLEKITFDQELSSTLCFSTYIDKSKKETIVSHATQPETILKNAYDFLTFKFEQHKNQHFPYKNFDEAKTFYEEKKYTAKKYFSPHDFELIELIDFIYTGRKKIE